MTELPELLNARIQEVSRAGKLRRLYGRRGLDLTSNDYLGFASDPVLKERLRATIKNQDIPLGASGSRLLRGQIEVFEKLEEKLALFSGKESSLFFLFRLPS